MRAARSLPRATRRKHTPTKEEDGVEYPFEEVQALDIVTSLDAKDRVHVGTVVDAPRRIVLSASPRVGVYTARIDRIRNLDGVYRVDN